MYKLDHPSLAVFGQENLDVLVRFGFGEEGGGRIRELVAASSHAFTQSSSGSSGESIAPWDRHGIAGARFRVPGTQ